MTAFLPIPPPRPASGAWGYLAAVGSLALPSGIPFPVVKDTDLEDLYAPAILDLTHPRAGVLTPSLEVRGYGYQIKAISRFRSSPAKIAVYGPLGNNDVASLIHMDLLAADAAIFQIVAAHAKNIEDLYRLEFRTVVVVCDPEPGPHIEAKDQEAYREMYGIVVGSDRGLLKRLGSLALPGLKLYLVDRTQLTPDFFRRLTSLV